MSVVLAAPSQGLANPASSIQYYSGSGATSLDEAAANIRSSGSNNNSLGVDINLANFCPERGATTSATSSRSSSCVSNASSSGDNSSICDVELSLKGETPSPVRLVENYHQHHYEKSQQQQAGFPTAGVKRKASESSSDGRGSNFSDHQSNQFENNFLGATSKRGRLDLGTDTPTLGSQPSAQDRSRMPSAFGVLETSEVTRKLDWESFNNIST